VPGTLRLICGALAMAPGRQAAACNPCRRGTGHTWQLASTNEHGGRWCPPVNKHMRRKMSLCRKMLCGLDSLWPYCAMLCCVVQENVVRA
jgi:hypothetical protein